MSSESERELSMEELKWLNHPQGSLTRQESTTTAQPASHPTQEEWAELHQMLSSLERRVAAQTALVRELSQRPRTYPTQEQIMALAGMWRQCGRCCNRLGNGKSGVPLSRGCICTFHISARRGC